MILRDWAGLLLWYLRRPQLYREFVRHVRRMGNATPASRERCRRTREAAQRWCAENATTVEELARALGIPGRMFHLPSAHPEAWASAIRAAAACPVKMGGPGYVDIIYNICVFIKPEVVIETGVAYGWSTLAILLALEDNGRGRLISVDRPYPGINNDEYVGCAVPDALRARWQLLRLADREGLPAALREAGLIDLAHYDSDKSAEGRAFAYKRLWSSLRPGGVLVSDDVGDNFAFRDFAAEVSKVPWIIPKGRGEQAEYIGLLVKEAAGPPRSAAGS